MRAPLTQPGVNVVTGEYLLSVNGRNVPGTAEVYSFFEATNGKQTLLRVGPNPDGTGSREVTVVPVANETGLRQLAWVEDNRRYVDKKRVGIYGTSYGGTAAALSLLRFPQVFHAACASSAAAPCRYGCTARTRAPCGPCRSFPESGSIAGSA